MLKASIGYLKLLDDTENDNAEIGSIQSLHVSGVCLISVYELLLLAFFKY